MSIACRVEIQLICGSDGYYKEGGVDHRASLPTILKAVRKLIPQLVYCPERDVPVLYFYENEFVKGLGDVSREGFPDPAEGRWEFPYLAIPCGDDDGDNPAEALRKLFLPELLQLLAGWGIDAKAYRFEIRQWYLDVAPDDTADFDCSDEEAVVDAYLQDEIPEEVMKHCFPRLLV